MFNIKENDENILMIKDDKGIEHKYYKLFSFDADNNKSYIAYTDGSKDSNGNVIINANIYDKTGNDLNLYPIETEEEWAIIQETFKEIENHIKDVMKNEKEVVGSSEE